MRAKFFKRTFSFLIDANLVFAIVYLIFVIVGRTILQHGTTDFIEHERLYNIETQYTRALLSGIDASAEAGDLTDEEHEALFEQYTTQYTERTEGYVAAQFRYYFNVVAYFFISFLALYYIYSLYFKGQTFGRKVLQLRLEGEVKWYSLFTREVLYKGFFGFLTLPIDAYLIMFSKQKKAIRDRVSGLYIVDESVKYPF